MKRIFQSKIDNEHIAELTRIQFEGRIVLIDRADQIDAACRELSLQRVIGFDTETRPAFQAGVVHKIALLQLSTHDTCYLFRLSKIQLERPILRILESKKILKIGAGIRDDLRSLQSLRRFRAGGFLDVQSIVGDYGIEELSVRKMAAIILGGRISKSQQLTKWDADELTPAQQLYAATDAWVVLEIYRKLMESEQQNPANHCLSIENSNPAVHHPPVEAPISPDSTDTLLHLTDSEVDTGSFK